MEVKWISAITNIHSSCELKKSSFKVRFIWGHNLTVQSSGHIICSQFIYFFKWNVHCLHFIYCPGGLQGVRHPMYTSNLPCVRRSNTRIRLISHSDGLKCAASQRQLFRSPGCAVSWALPLSARTNEVAVVMNMKLEQLMRGQANFYPSQSF